MVTAELYRNTNIKPQELGSAAFNLEYQENSSKASIREDIVSYLGEYRFKIPKYEYSLFYKKDQATGRTSVFAQDQELMATKSKRAIRERRLRGESTHREENETLGLLNLEAQLSNARPGDTIFWASPPGPKEEGYGDYGFIYQGKIQEGTIRMAALRVENPTIEQYNRAMAALTGVQYNFYHANDFLRSPHIARGPVPDSYTEHVLKQMSVYAPDEQKQTEFESAIRILNPMIDRAVSAIQHGSREEKLSTFYALENYAIELRERKAGTALDSASVDYIILSRNYEPPVSRGSCGSSASQSNLLFSGDSIVNSLMRDKYGDREFKCPKCNMINVRPEDKLLEKCQHCGSTEVSCEGNEENYQEAA